MAISFNEVPQAWRVPGMLVEFDNSEAMQGATTQVYTVLLAGQMLPMGTAAAATPCLVTSVVRARELFGRGSMLAHMCEGFLANNSVTRMYAMGLGDDASATAATGTVTFTGSVVSAAPINLYIGGRKARCAAMGGHSAVVVAAAMAEAVNAEPDMPVTAEALEGVLTLTAKHKGEEGNAIDVRLSYYEEALPTGMSISITPFSGGAGNPDMGPIIAGMGDHWYHVLALGWTDRSNLHLMETELEGRWGPLRHIDGVALVCRNDAYAALTTFGLGQSGQGNYSHIAIAECTGSPDLPWVRAAMLCGVTAYYGNMDPARPFQTLVLKGALPPLQKDRMSQEEQNLLLYAGIATTTPDDGGRVCVQRLITNYRTTASGAPDESYLDVNTLLTLSYLRFDFRARILRKYPRHKLASDGTKFGEGQAVMTPKTGKAEAVAAFMDWMELGLVEKLDKFKEHLLCQRNSLDPNRLDWLMPPDLVNGFIVGAAQIQFRLEEKE